MFNPYLEYSFKEVSDNTDRVIKVNGVGINNLRYADDTTLLVESPQELQKLIVE